MFVHEGIPGQSCAVDPHGVLKSSRVTADLVGFAASTARACSLTAGTAVSQLFDAVVSVLTHMDIEKPVENQRLGSSALPSRPPHCPRRIGRRVRSCRGIPAN